MGSMKIAIGSDHAGFELKEGLAIFLREQGVDVLDVGTRSSAPCDYPDFARKVAEKLLHRGAERGILVDGVGGSSAMVANKYPGIRAVPCHDAFTVQVSREHSDSNVLCLGSKLVDISTAQNLVEDWLRIEPLAQEKYKNRLRKIQGIEKENFSSSVWRPPASRVPRRQVVTEDDVYRAIRNRVPIQLSKKAILTPSARDLIREKNVPVVEKD